MAREHFNGGKETKFSKAAVAGEQFFSGVATGDPKPYVHLSGKTRDFQNADQWPSVEAVWIVWLCTNPDASKLVTYHGINIEGARIHGKIDLDGARVPFCLVASDCAFTDEVILTDSHVQQLNLNGSHVRSLTADRAHIEGNVFLREGFESNGEVRVAGATIDGDLDCVGSHFSSASGNALIADKAKIGGSVFLNAESDKNGRIFKADGEVNFAGATIGGNLECFGGNFSNAGRNALKARGAKISGNVMLKKSRNGGQNCKVEGEVNLAGAKIGGDLDCDGGHLLNTLVASNAKIAGNVFFINDFRALGEINLKGAEVTGYLIWQKVGSSKSPIVHLESAKVGTLRDEKSSWTRGENLFLDGFVYDRIDSGNGAPTGAESRLNWLKRMPKKQFFPQPYEQLATVLKNMGHEEEAANVLIAMNQEHGRHLSITTRGWWWYNFFGWFSGYGYRPSRAFWVSVGVIVFGYGVFSFGNARGLMWPTDEKLVEMDSNAEPVKVNGRVKVPKDYSRFNALIYSLETFTPLLQLGQNASWRPNANRGNESRLEELRMELHARSRSFARLDSAVCAFLKILIGQQLCASAWRCVFTIRVTTGGVLRGYLWLHIIFGWVLTTLWVGALTGLVKT